jgi:hypothetical protein
MLRLRSPEAVNAQAVKHGKCRMWPSGVCRSPPGAFRDNPGDGKA